EESSVNEFFCRKPNLYTDSRCLGGDYPIGSLMQHTHRGDSATRTENGYRTSLSLRKCRTDHRPVPGIPECRRRRGALCVQNLLLGRFFALRGCTVWRCVAGTWTA